MHISQANRSSGHECVVTGVPDIDWWQTNDPVICSDDAIISNLRIFLLTYTYVIVSAVVKFVCCSGNAYPSYVQCFNK